MVDQYRMESFDIPQFFCPIFGELKGYGPRML